MAKYLKSQQRIIDALLDEPDRMSQQQFRALATTRRPARAAKTRNRRGAKTVH